MPATIDVVIPLFNGAPWIEATLRGVLAQTAPLGTVVVVDDGSADDGPARARRVDPRVRLVSSTGKLRARHTGLGLAKSAFVAFLDQDDVWHPRHLADLATVLEAHPAAPAAASCIRRFRDGEEPQHEILDGPLQRIDPWAAWPFVCPITTPSAVLYRRTALVGAGGWALDVAPDWESYLRIAMHVPILGTPSATCAYRLHVTARSSELRRSGQEYLDIVSRAADASLTYRLAQGKDDGGVCARLERRQRIFRHYLEFLRSVHVGEEDAAQRAARALESSIAREPDAYLRHFARIAVYLLCPEDDPEEHLALSAELMRRIERALPDDVPRTRHAFLDLGHTRPFRWQRLIRHVAKGRLPSAWALLRQRRDELRAGTDSVFQGRR